TPGGLPSLLPAESPSELTPETFSEGSDARPTRRSAARQRRVVKNQRPVVKKLTEKLHGLFVGSATALRTNNGRSASAAGTGLHARGRGKTHLQSTASRSPQSDCGRSAG